MIAGIILASGYSKRMRRDKLLLEFNSKKAVENVILAAKNSMLSRVILVYRRDKIRIIGESHGIEAIENNRAYLGQSESVKLGVSQADNVEGYLFLVGDQPLISADFINQIILKFKTCGKGIVIPIYKDKIKMPILFSNKYRDELLASEGEQGGYEIIENNPADIIYIDVKDFYEVADFDHYEEYLKFLEDKEGN
ncbi:MAG: NTP transferase domain-containing protein [Gudongella sp.]|nr:NTP transferase domain-containing protein [Gudongella sp.]